MRVVSLAEGRIPRRGLPPSPMSDTHGLLRPCWDCGRRTGSLRALCPVRLGVTPGIRALCPGSCMAGAGGAGGLVGGEGDYYKSEKAETVVGGRVGEGRRTCDHPTFLGKQHACSTSADSSAYGRGTAHMCAIRSGNISNWVMLRIGQLLCSVEMQPTTRTPVGELLHRRMTRYSAS